jgi:hypothetical protein
MPTDSSLVPSCGCIMRGSVEGIDGDAFKIPAVEGFPTAMASPCHMHKAEVGYGTKRVGP